MSDAFDWPAYLPDFIREAEARGFSRKVLSEHTAGPVVAFEKPGTGRRVYVSAGIHGDEPAGPLALLQLMRDGFFQADAHWLVCPALNPDGLAAHTRENADGLDLNRDYLARRSSEARAHAAWIEELPAPQLFLSLHEDWETAGFYFYEINLSGHPPGDVCGILHAVSPWFQPEPGPEIDGHLAKCPGWIYHEAEPDIPESWPEAILIARKGCPLSFTFESPSSSPLDHRVAALAAAVRTAFSRSAGTTPPACFPPAAADG